MKYLRMPENALLGSGLINGMHLMSPDPGDGEALWRKKLEMTEKPLA